MSIKELTPIQSRIVNIDYLKNTPQYRQFDCCEIFSNISPVNQEFLQNMPELVNVYLNCLKDVTRWKDHPYQSDKNPIVDDDYQHTLEMLKISNDLKKLGVESINFDEVEIMIIAHDGGEIITDDMSLYHSLE